MLRFIFATFCLNIHVGSFFFSHSKAKEKVLLQVQMEKQGDYLVHNPDEIEDRNSTFIGVTDPVAVDESILVPLEKMRYVAPYSLVFVPQ